MAELHVEFEDVETGEELEAVFHITSWGSRGTMEEPPEPPEIVFESAVDTRGQYTFDEDAFIKRTGMSKEMFWDEVMEIASRD